MHVVCGYCQKSIDFQRWPFQNGRLAAILDFFGFGTVTLVSLWISSHWHITCVYGKKPINFQQCHFQNNRLAAILDFSVAGLCSWHGFRCVTRVCCGISISNFISMMFVVRGKSLWILRYVTYKMTAWRSNRIFQFPDSNFSSALNIKSKLQLQITFVYWNKPIDFQQYHCLNGRLVAILDFSVSRLNSWYGFRGVTRVCFGISISNSSACCLWPWTKAY